MFSLIVWVTFSIYQTKYLSLFATPTKALLLPLQYFASSLLMLSDWKIFIIKNIIWENFRNKKNYHI
jgi:hypothetical protein